jgi:hypothetical protein
MRSLLAAVTVALALAGPAAAAKPLMFVEGPFTWDDSYPAGTLCDFPVRVTGEIVAEQTWFVSGFPPLPGEEWSTLTRFTGAETWTNLDSGKAATDAFRYLVRHDWAEWELLRTVQTGNSTNVKGGALKEAGRTVWLGEDLGEPTEWHGRFVQFPDPGAWYEARCATIG